MANAEAPTIQEAAYYHGSGVTCSVPGGVFPEGRPVQAGDTADCGRCGGRGFYPTNGPAKMDEELRVCNVCHGTRRLVIQAEQL